MKEAQPEMTADEAIAILDNGVSQLNATRVVHLRFLRAIAVINHKLKVQMIPDVPTVPTYHKPTE